MNSHQPPPQETRKRWWDDQSQQCSTAHWTTFVPHDRNVCTKINSATKRLVHAAAEHALIDTSRCRPPGPFQCTEPAALSHCSQTWKFTFTAVFFATSKGTVMTRRRIDLHLAQVLQRHVLRSIHDHPTFQYTSGVSGTVAVKPSRLPEQSNDSQHCNVRCHSRVQERNTRMFTTLPPRRSAAHRVQITDAPHCAKSQANMTTPR